MTTMTELMLMSGASASTLSFLRKFGLEVEDEDFEIDRTHRKALNELRLKRVSPYVIAYALTLQPSAAYEDCCRFQNITNICKIRDLSLGIAFHDVRGKHIKNDLLPNAAHWIDRATEFERHLDAFERLARWCKDVIAASPYESVGYTYLAVRLLMSLPREKMCDYPRMVQRALNRTKHHGFLDGWWRNVPNEEGKNSARFSRPKYDL